LETGEPYIVAECQERRIDRDAVEYYEWRISRIPLPSGQHGVVCYFRDVSAQVEARRTIAESEERFRALVTASSDAVYSMNADWSEMRHLQGRDFIADAASLNRTWLASYVPEADQAQVRQAVDAALQNKTMFELEHRILRVDGTIGWTYSRAVPLKNEQGAIVEWFGAAKDITARKHEEEQRKLLLDELNHRVKNTLSTVQSVASQTMRTTHSFAEFQEAFNARLLALSRAHNLLTRRNWQGANLFDVVRETLQPYDDPSASRLAFEGLDLMLAPGAAIMLNLVLHEMATNAAKYGALSTSFGRITVFWAGREIAGERWVELSWLEKDGPEVAPPTRAGFGSKLIQRGIEEELEGAVELDYDPAGLRCAMRWPFMGNVIFSD
jgi:two-component sensor histidine kinase